MKNNTQTKRHQGFTLVEIMIVVAIIGLLAGIALPNFIKARATSQTNACINNLRQIDAAKQQWALENHQTDTGSPADADITPYLGRTSAGGLGSILCPLDTQQTFDTSYTIGTVAQLPMCKTTPATHKLLN